ncbi:MAG: ABC transporter permease [Lachnospiraceae bacterium]|nr:ABC transporter permease [Lachnospiraceae bacterium]
MSLILSVFEQGMIYAIMALGVYITYKILDFPDMTVDGSFPMGAAITAVLINKGVNPLLTLPICFVAGGVVGIITGLIHVKLKVRDLLAGIIMMTGLYSVNLRIAGKANLPFYNQPTIFENDFLSALFPSWLANYRTVIICLIITIIVKYLLDWYMSTKSGFLLRAVGDNDTLVTSLGVDKGLVRIVGLSLANALVTLSGCLYAQQQGFFDSTMGTGTAVMGLAGVIIGASLFKKFTLFKVTASVVIGMLLYKGCVALAIWVGMPASDMKLITAVLFLIILVLTSDRKKKVTVHA